MNYAAMSKGQYLFYLLRHPVTGFEEMKFNRKGSVKYANILLVLFYICSVISQVGTGYLFETKTLEDINIFWILAGTVGVVIVWCVSNWMFCTLLDGKGRFEEIWVATCYSLLPYVLLSLPMTIISHFLTNNEALFYNVAMALIYAWVGLLLFIGMMSMHQFSMPKNILTILFTCAGIVLILFLLVLLFTLGQNVWTFIITIVNELNFRFR